MPRFATVTGNRAFRSAPFRFSRYAVQFGKVEGNVLVPDDLDVELVDGRVVIRGDHPDLVEKYGRLTIGP